MYQQRIAQEESVSDSRDVDHQSGDREAEVGFFPSDRMTDLRRQWVDVQAGFVDNPRASVEEAHAMVVQIIDELSNVFTQERTALERDWNRERTPDTELLRIALQRYRAFFNRLLGSAESSDG